MQGFSPREPVSESDEQYMIQRHGAGWWEELSGEESVWGNKV